jgi:hypothetical protein
MGRSVRCSVCGNAVFVPAAKTPVGAQLANQEVQAWIRVPCECGKIIKVPPQWAGKRGHCPRCGVEKTMPLTLPSYSAGEHDSQTLSDPNDQSALDFTPVTAVEPTAPPRLTRPLPKPQPRDEIVPEDEVFIGNDESGMIDEFAVSQIVRKSGLLDLTGAEEVAIVDGVAPALWAAKRWQRAEAIKAGTTAQKEEYVRRTFTERVIRARRRIDTLLYRNPGATIAVSLAVLFCSGLFLYHSLHDGARRKASPGGPDIPKIVRPTEAAE